MKARTELKRSNKGQLNGKDELAKEDGYPC